MSGRRLKLTIQQALQNAVSYQTFINLRRKKASVTKDLFT
jgi:hypothetical protein